MLHVCCAVRQAEGARSDPAGCSVHVSQPLLQQLQGSRNGLQHTMRIHAWRRLQEEQQQRGPARTNAPAGLSQMIQHPATAAAAAGAVLAQKAKAPQHPAEWLCRGAAADAGAGLSSGAALTGRHSAWGAPSAALAAVQKLLGAGCVQVPAGGCSGSSSSSASSRRRQHHGHAGRPAGQPASVRAAAKRLLISRAAGLASAAE